MTSAIAYAITALTAAFLSQQTGIYLIKCVCRSVMISRIVTKILSRGKAWDVSRD
jgi:hypothetical protein